MLARQWVSLAQSFIQPAEEPAGSVNQAQLQPFRWRTFPLVMQTTERPLVTMEPFSEPQMGEALGLVRQAERPRRSWAFPLLMPIMGRLSVNLGRFLELPTEALIGCPSKVEQLSC